MLALNGADERLQLVLGRLPAAGGDAPGAEPELLASQEWTVPGQAVRFLAPAVRNMLHGLGLTAADVGRIACVRGPGSFTGLRMSLAAAEGLSAGTGALLAGLDHLALLARDAAEIHATTGAVLALSWSRRAQVYAQAFAGRNALTEPLVQTLAELPALLAALPRPLLLLGGGLRRNLEAVRAMAEADSGVRLLPARWDAPRPETLLALAAEARYSAEPLSPVYLRPSDAEDNLAAIAAGRGLSEGEARAILERGSHDIEP